MGKGSKQDFLEVLKNTLKFNSENKRGVSMAVGKVSISYGEHKAGIVTNFGAICEAVDCSWEGR